MRSPVMKKKKKLLSLLGVILIVALFTGGCQPDEKSKRKVEKTIVIAKVDDHIISKVEYDKKSELLKNVYSKKFGENIWTQEIGNRPVKEIVQEELLENMIREVLIVSYAKQKGYTPKEDEKQKRYEQFQDVLKRSEEAQELYSKTELDKEFIMKQVEVQLYAKAFKLQIEKEVRSDTQALEQAYKDEAVLFSASHILVHDEKTAKEIKEKIHSGESFSELAITYSQDPGSALNGGSLGGLSKGDMLPAFEQAIFSMKVGEISEPIRTQRGFHIIKLEKTQTIFDLEADEASQEEIDIYKNKIVSERVSLAMVQKINELLEKAEIERFIENIREK